jgi:hypothetical protein
MTPVIQDARRRQRRRQRVGALGAAGLVLVSAAVFRARHFATPRRQAASMSSKIAPTTTSFAYVTDQGASGLTIRRVLVTTPGERRYGPNTLISPAKLRRIHATAVATVDPSTGAIEVRVVDRNGTPTMTTK